MKLYIKPLHNTKALKIDEPAQNQVDLVEKILKWGEDDNNMPYFITTTVQRSVTGSSCSKTYLQYLYGNGFNDKDVARALDSVLYNVAQQYRTFRAFALKVYLQAGTMNIAKVEPISIEHLRLSTPNKMGEVETIKYNQFFGSSYDYRTYKSKTYPLWDEDKRKRYELATKYPNSPFILFHADWESFSSPYPLPDYWGDNSSHGGGYEAMIADYALGKLLTKELFDGFMQNVILNMVGNPDEPITEHASLAAEGKAYTTKGEAFQKELDRNFKGLDGASMMILWSQIKDQFPEVKAFPSSFNYDKLQGVVDTVRTQVATAWNVPSILANIATSGTLSKDDITSAVRLMWGVVRRKQLTLERYFQVIVDELSLTTKPELLGKKALIENYSPFPIVDLVDDKIWNELTAQEKRLFIKNNTNVELIETVDPTTGAPLADNTGTNNVLTNLTGRQLQGIQRIVRQYNQQKLTYDQAAIMLKNGFGFNDVDVEAWLVTPEEEGIE